MVFCFQAELAFNSANRRNNVRTALENRINGKSRWDVDFVISRPVHAGANGLVSEWRFTSRADQEDLQAHLEGLTPSNPPLAGSFIRLHDCTHDELTNVCTVTYTRTW